MATRADAAVLRTLLRTRRAWPLGAGTKAPYLCSVASSGAGRCTARHFCSEPTPAEEKEPEKEKEKPALPLTLWQARSLTKEIAATEAAINRGAAVSAAGYGLLFLGMAPLTPPGPFMAGMLIAMVQVRLAQGYTVRQLHAQARRHVTRMELTEEVEGETMVLSLAFDGGLTRTLRLAAKGNDKPSFAEVLSSCRDFVLLDEELGVAEDKEVLDRVRSTELGIVSEEFSVKPLLEESQAEAEKMVQPLHSLTNAQLAKMKPASNPPLKAFAEMDRMGRLLSGAILAFGAVGLLGGRFLAAKDA